MSRQYQFAIEGSAADGQTWLASGDVTDNANDLAAVFHDAMRGTFQQLTNGKAVFGKPGVGCRGPYKITRILIERVL